MKYLMNNEIITVLFYIFSDNILTIILYGSVARNENTPESDIDIAIGIKNNMDVINNYHKLNSKCDIIHIANAKLYPQLELPEKTASIIKKIVTN